MWPVLRALSPYPLAAVSFVPRGNTHLLCRRHLVRVAARWDTRRPWAPRRALRALRVQRGRTTLRLDWTASCAWRAPTRRAWEHRLLRFAQIALQEHLRQQGRHLAELVYHVLPGNIQPEDLLVFNAQEGNTLPPQPLLAQIAAQEPSLLQGRQLVLPVRPAII